MSCGECWAVGFIHEESVMKKESNRVLQTGSRLAQQEERKRVLQKIKENENQSAKIALKKLENDIFDDITKTGGGHSDKII